MSERRMFAKTIIDSDAFLDMPITARLLYYDLGMRADDDGFVNSPKKIMRITGASTDDINILIAKKFIIPFESGVVVIKHWKIHNYIRKDSYVETKYKEEKALLELDENNAYRLPVTDSSQTCDNVVTVMSTQDRIGKDRIGKDRINISLSNDNDCQTQNVQLAIERWNSNCISPVSQMSKSSTRYKMLSSRIKEYGIDTVLKTMDKVKESTFLKGGNQRSWVVTLDWFVKPNNFPKVMDGNYDDRKTNSGDSNNQGWEEKFLNG